MRVWCELSRPAKDAVTIYMQSKQNAAESVFVLKPNHWLVKGVWFGRTGIKEACIAQSKVP